ncbi:MAG: hypothetical protein LIO79_10850 [Rikenellaceae bacterium]|nr:hypothetical protein [Rikenellaceae bacterium]
MSNIFDLPAVSPKELFDTILDRQDVEWMKIERIASYGLPSPDSGWYVQDWEEWVLIVRGSAQIEFGDGRISELAEGDNLLIGRNIKHKVPFTTEDCVWLAVHFKSKII